MSITVTCPGCKKHFTVSDKFAGKSGPCKYCKTTITIPNITEKVVIHGGEAFADGGRDAKGKLILKPLTRARRSFDQNKALFICIGVLTVILIAWILGKSIDLNQNWLIAAAGLCLVTPVLVGGLYPAIKKEEMLESIHGFEFYWRTAVISLVYAGIWGAITYLMNIGALSYQTPIAWAIYTLVLAMFGAFMCMCFYELDWTTALFHTATFLCVTVFLRYVSGILWFSEVIINTGSGNAPPPPPPIP